MQNILSRRCYLYLIVLYYMQQFLVLYQQSSFRLLLLLYPIKHVKISAFICLFPTPIALIYHIYYLSQLSNRLISLPQRLIIIIIIQPEFLSPSLRRSISYLEIRSFIIWQYLYFHISRSRIRWRSRKFKFIYFRSFRVVRCCFYVLKILFLIGWLVTMTDMLALCRS